VTHTVVTQTVVTQTAAHAWQTKKDVCQPGAAPCTGCPFNGKEGQTSGRAPHAHSRTAPRPWGI
jgi:hypothetical protein